MSYELSIEKRDNFLHATVTGTNSIETVLGYMNDVKARCATLDCYRVLIDEKLEGPRLDEMEILTLISEGSAEAAGFFDALAFVDDQMESDLSRFAETAAVNRGIPMATFSSVEDAEFWLRRQHADQSGEVTSHGRDPDEADS